MITSSIVLMDQESQTSTRVNFGHPSPRAKFTSHEKLHVSYETSIFYVPPTYPHLRKKKKNKNKIAEGGPDSTIPFISIYDDHLPCQGAISKHAQKIGVLMPTRHLYGKANCRNCRTKTCRFKDANFKTWIQTLHRSKTASF